MSDFILSPDQEQALDKLDASIRKGTRVSLLTGLAGTGKTTVMKAMVERHEKDRDVVLLAPTGKAASVLQAKTGRVCQTIHGALYQDREEDGDDVRFAMPGPPCAAGGLVFCDEASMVGSKLYRDLVENLPEGAQLQGLGDQGQLQPVKDDWGFDFTKPTATLTQIHRQAGDNPIVLLAHALRENRMFTEWKAGVCEQGLDRPVEWLVQHLRSPGSDATLLAFTNKTRARMNHKVRARLGRVSLLEAGDKVLCLHNNFDIGMMNGEVLDVLEVERSKIQPKPPWGGSWPEPNVVTLRLRDWQGGSLTVRTNLAFFGKPLGEYLRWRKAVIRRQREAWKNLVHLDYGFALTVHKAQGSEWRDVGFVADNGYSFLFNKDYEAALRLAYTAVTRARERLAIFGRL